jgi:hypothetical protein
MACARPGCPNNDAARRLAAILAADVVGYSRLMGKDEEGRCNLTEPAPRAAWSHTVAVQPHRPCDPRADCRHLHRSDSPYVLSGTRKRRSLGWV